MSNTPNVQTINDPPPNKKGFFSKLLDRIETYGNKLPDPVTLFVIIAAVILVASSIASLLGVSAVHPSTKEVIEAKNLLNGEGLIMILTGMVNVFVDFPPLGVVLVAMIGVGLAESTGLISALMRRTMLGAPPKIVIPVIIFVGIIGNAAGDTAFIVLPPIAAMLLMSLGYNPLIGLVVAYAAVAGGFTANIFLNILDVITAGFTEVGAQIVDPDYKANVAMNYYFSIVSTFALMIVATLITYKITIPRLGKYTGEIKVAEKLTDEEKRGLRWAGWSMLVFTAIMLYLTVPSNALLRNAETGSLVSDSPLMAALIPIVMLMFLIPAIFYGMGAKTIKNDKDVANMLNESMKTMAPYIILAFVAAQMIAYFNWSNLGPILAISGADFLKNIGFTGIGLIICFVILTAILDFLLASSSAKWAILAPVFVPMFMLLGYDPALTQLAYRIGDSVTNPITPMLAYFAILLSFAKVYDKRAGIGTLMTALIPFSVFFLITFLVLLTVWYFLGLPLGPGGYIFLPE